MSSYPIQICRECGLKHGRIKPTHDHSIWQGDCDICGKNAPVTAPRDYGHLKDDWRRMRFAEEIQEVIRVENENMKKPLPDAFVGMNHLYVNGGINEV